MADFDVDAAATELMERAKDIAEAGGIGFENAFVPLFAATCRAAKQLDRAEFLAGAMILNLPMVIKWAEGRVALSGDQEEEVDLGED